MGKKRKKSIKNRIAVVVIHGIGEQRPMSTLRGMVTSLINYERGVLSPKKVKRTRYWVKPDRFSNSYELRKISAEANCERITTHFYEYHWAANMRDSNARHLWSWLCSLMKKPFRYYHWRIGIIRVLLLILFVLWLWNSFCLLICTFLLEPYPLHTTYISIRILGFLAPFLLVRVFPKILLGFIADAARYMSSDVNNIAQREIIRKNGISFLKKLHFSGDYSRIVIVGHSLGSVIAYDLITYLWIDFNKSVRLTSKKFKNDKWKGSVKYDEETTKILKETCDAAWQLHEHGGYNEKFIEKQNEFWKAISKNKEGWLISDLITLGSPLTHADSLMFLSKENFEDNKADRVYPTCPPSPDSENKVSEGNSFPYHYYVYGNLDTDKFLNHATPFLATRWTNLYFPSDIIGGKLESQFGKGINDVKVLHNGCSFLKAFRNYISPLSHTSYWREKSDPKTIENSKEGQAIAKLYEAFNFNKDEDDPIKETAA